MFVPIFRKLLIFIFTNGQRLFYAISNRMYDHYILFNCPC